MQAIFQYEQNSDTTPEYIRTFVAEQLNYPELEEFCVALVEGILSRHAEIDQLLTRAATNWKLDRMATVDRAILRLGVYEMAFAPDRTPPRVVITECVEIAKRFSTFESSRFVNGVLDRVSRNLAGDEELATRQPSDETLPTEEGPPVDESLTAEESPTETVSLNDETVSEIPLTTDLPNGHQPRPEPPATSPGDN